MKDQVNQLFQEQLSEWNPRHLTIPSLEHTPQQVARVVAVTLTNK